MENKIVVKLDFLNKKEQKKNYIDCNDEGKVQYYNNDDEKIRYQYDRFIVMI